MCLKCIHSSLKLGYIKIATRNITTNKLCFFVFFLFFFLGGGGLVVLYAADTVLIERNSGKRLDPFTEGAVFVSSCSPLETGVLLGPRSIIILAL